MEIIAHRGASAYAPENTASAIRLAALQGATWVEFDVRTSKDNIAVLMHDSYLERTSNGKGKVINKTLKELKKLDCGSWFSKAYKGERILSFAELIDLCQTLNLFMQVELKPDFGYEEELVMAIKKDVNDDILQQCLFSSFNDVALTCLRAIIPNAKMAVLVEHITDDCLKRLTERNVKVLHFWNKDINEPALKEIHKAGILTRSYTVNEPADALHLKSLGVSAIFTDYPDKMMALKL